MNTKRKPVVAVLEPGYANYQTERDILSAVDAEIIPVGVDQDPVSTLRDTTPDILMVRERVVDHDLLNALPRVKGVIRYGVGVDNIDLDTARKRRIYVANVPDYGAEQEVSDHAIALYLAVSRRIVTRSQQMREGVWGVGQKEIIYGHQGATLGLVGFGHIARQAFKKFKALGFGRTLVIDPALDQADAQQLGVELTDLPTLCRESDAISLHAKLTPETHHIIDRDCLALMKVSTVLVNVGRGELIDEAALVEALGEKRIFGAGLDVFEREPPGIDHPLFTFPGVVVSDHAAWYSESTVRALQSKGARQALAVLQGNQPPNWVNQW